MKLVDKINKYLTSQFIGDWSDIPEDECLDEAKNVLDIVFKDIAQLLKNEEE